MTSSATPKPEMPELNKLKFTNPPCFICGYNGMGYYQPHLHGCAKYYHGYEPWPDDLTRPAPAVDLEALEILRVIVANARMIPDPAMNGTTDCYSVPLDDIDEAKNVLAKT